MSGVRSVIISVLIIQTLQNGVESAVFITTEL